MSTENILTAHKMGRYGRGRARRIRAKRASLDRLCIAEKPRLKACSFSNGWSYAGRKKPTRESGLDFPGARFCRGLVYFASALKRALRTLTSTSAPVAVARALASRTSA